MARPERIRYTRGGAVPYDSGSFHYDEATNIYQMGADTYRYDKASRLTYATVARAGSRWEKYWIDPFDNIFQGQQENNTPISFPVDSTTNRRPQTEPATESTASLTPRGQFQNEESESQPA